MGMMLRRRRAASPKKAKEAVKDVTKPKKSNTARRGK